MAKRGSTETGAPPPAPPKSDGGGGSGWNGNDPVCPECEHERAKLVTNWADKIEDFIRARLNLGQRPISAKDCHFGSDYNWDGCECTHPYHSI